MNRRYGLHPKNFAIGETEKYYTNMASKGWHLVKRGITFSRFEKAEPRQMRYRIEVVTPSLLEDGHLPEEQVAVYGDCGWEYVTDMMGYAYFRKSATEMVEDEGIFCDDESKIEMIERVYKGRMIPLIVIFCCIIIPQLFMQSHNTSEAGRMLFIVFVVLFILYLSIFIKFACQYWNVKNRKED